MIRRAFIIVLDGCGIGALPDAHRFSDEGANTLVNLSKKIEGGLRLPNLERLGLGRIAPIAGMSDKAAAGCYGKMAEKNPAKNTDAGHWELMGLIMDEPFPVYPKGFPDDLIKMIEKEIGTGIIGNIPASGTEIIQAMGEEHLRTGKPILYTSTDSVLQLAAHVDIIPAERLYEMCAKARSALRGRWLVGRVIARPFTGLPGRFSRLNGLRKDYQYPPPRKTALDIVKDSGREVISFGEVDSLFCGQGITNHMHTRDNREGFLFLTSLLASDFEGVAFGNLTDTDMVYGHRRDPAGYYSALRGFDKALGGMIAALKDDDILIVTADHGNDPTYKGTDHTREYVPLLVTGPGCRRGADLGTREAFSDVGKTVCEAFSLRNSLPGTSFLKEIL